MDRDAKPVYVVSQRHNDPIWVIKETLDQISASLGNVADGQNRLTNASDKSNTYLASSKDGTKRLVDLREQDKGRHADYMNLLGGIGSGIQGLNRGIESFAWRFSRFDNTLSGITAAIGVGGAVGTFAGVVDKATEHYREFLSVGAGFNGGILEMANVAHAAGMSIGELAKVVKQFPTVAAATSARQMAQFNKDITTVARQFMSFGLKTEQLQEYAGQYQEILRVQGRIDSVERGQARGEFIDALKMMTDAAKVSGQDQQEVIKRAFEGLQDPETAYALQTIEMQDPKEAARLREVFMKLQASYNKEVSDKLIKGTLSAVISGTSGSNEDIRNIAAINPQILSTLDNIARSGDMSTDEAVQRIDASLKGQSVAQRQTNSLLVERNSELAAAARFQMMAGQSIEGIDRNRARIGGGDPVDDLTDNLVNLEGQLHDTAVTMQQVMTRVATPAFELLNKGGLGLIDINGQLKKFIGMAEGLLPDIRSGQYWVNQKIAGLADRQGLDGERLQQASQEVLAYMGGSVSVLTEQGQQLKDLMDAESITAENLTRALGATVTTVAGAAGTAAASATDLGAAAAVVGQQSANVANSAQQTTSAANAMWRAHTAAGAAAVAGVEQTVAASEQAAHTSANIAEQSRRATAAMPAPSPEALTTFNATLTTTNATLRDQLVPAAASIGVFNSQIITTTASLRDQFGPAATALSEQLKRWAQQPMPTVEHPEINIANEHLLAIRDNTASLVGSNSEIMTGVAAMQQQRDLLRTSNEAMDQQMSILRTIGGREVDLASMPVPQINFPGNELVQIMGSSMSSLLINHDQHMSKLVERADATTIMANELVRMTSGLQDLVPRQQIEQVDSEAMARSTRDALQPMLQDNQNIAMERALADLVTLTRDYTETMRYVSGQMRELNLNILSLRRNVSDLGYSLN